MQPTLNYRYRELMCSLLHSMMFSHQSAKGYRDLPMMKEWHLGRRDACRSIIRNSLRELDEQERRPVLIALRKVTDWSRRHPLN